MEWEYYLVNIQKQRKKEAIISEEDWINFKKELKDKKEEKEKKEEKLFLTIKTDLDIDEVGYIREENCFHLNVITKTCFCKKRNQSFVTSSLFNDGFKFSNLQFGSYDLKVIRKMDGYHLYMFENYHFPHYYYISEEERKRNYETEIQRKTWTNAFFDWIGIYSNVEKEKSSSKKVWIHPFENPEIVYERVPYIHLPNEDVIYNLLEKDNQCGYDHNQIFHYVSSYFAKDISILILEYFWITKIYEFYIESWNLFRCNRSQICFLSLLTHYKWDRDESEDLVFRTIKIHLEKGEFTAILNKENMKHITGVNYNVREEGNEYIPIQKILFE